MITSTVQNFQGKTVCILIAMIHMLLHINITTHVHVLHITNECKISLLPYYMNGYPFSYLTFCDVILG